MGTSAGVVQFVAKAQRAAKAIEDIAPKAVAQTADAAVDMLNESVGRAAPSGRLTPRKVKVGARRRQRIKEAIALVTPYGPIGLIEGDLGPHLVGTGRRQRKVSSVSGNRFTLVGGASKSGRTDYAKGNAQFLKGKAFGHPVRGPLYHPGTKGKQPWAQVRPRIDRMYPPHMANPFLKGISEVYR